MMSGSPVKQSVTRTLRPGVVSIIVPVYSSERFLTRCIESIVNQDYPFIEAIFVNDASPDGCASILERYRSLHEDKMIVITHDENRGLGCARNSGMAAASGEFIGFVDADDWIDSRFVSKCVEALERTGADVAATGMSYEYGTPVSSSDKFAYETENVISSSFALELLCNRFSSDLYMSSMVSNKIYRRQLVDERAPRFEETSQDNDVEFTFTLLCEPCDVVLVPDVKYRYAQHEDSMLHSVSGRTLRDMMHTFRRLKAHLEEKGAYEDKLPNLLALFDKCSTTMVDCLLASPTPIAEKYGYISSFYDEAVKLFPSRALVEQIGIERIARFHGL